MQRFEHGGDVYGADGTALRLDFSVNTNPLGLPPAVDRALRTHLSELAHYPDPACRALRAALAQRHGLSSTSVLCGNGASELILALCACVRPKRVLLTAPTFSEYERAALRYGSTVRLHALDAAADFVLDRRILLEIEAGADILFLCTPNNPTGRLADRDLLEEIVAACQRRGILLLLDECFLDFTMGESLLPLLHRYPGLLILRAFTKIYAMAGLRLGTLYSADQELLQQIASYCPTWSVSTAAQIAGLAALQEKDWLSDTRRLIIAERAYMTRALRELGLYVCPSDANFLLLRSEQPLWQPLREKGLLMRCCDNYSGLDERYLRIGVKTHAENEILLHAIREVLHG